MVGNPPLRFSNAGNGMVQRGTNEVIMLDSGSFPGFSNYLNESWSWNGTNWQDLSPNLVNSNSPLPTRLDFSMAYDGTRVVMFGGRGSSSTTGILQDTWLWSGSTTGWTKATPTTSPFGRYAMAMSQLGTSGSQIVMFGGVGGAAGANILSETWTWNSSSQNWTLQSPTTVPAARYGHCMAANSTNVLMFGGQGTNNLFNGLHQFSSGTLNWTNLNASNSPSVRTGACMAYDPNTNLFVMFGGKDYYNILNQTWTYNPTSNAWTQQNPTFSPAGRYNAQMCYDSQSGHIIMLGGVNASNGYSSNDTFSYNTVTNNWTAL